MIKREGKRMGIKKASDNNLKMVEGGDRRKELKEKYKIKGTKMHRGEVHK